MLLLRIFDYSFFSHDEDEDGDVEKEEKKEGKEIANARMR